MMKFRFRKWVAASLLGLCSSATFAQAPDGWQFGTGVGLQRFTNNVVAQPGLGVQASVGRWLIPQLGANLAIDYSSLPFQQTLRAQGISVLNTRESNVFSAALLLDYSLPTQARVSPYVKLGGGLESIQVGNSARQLYAAGIAGAGLRVKIQPQIALHVHGDYHLMDVRVLNGFSPNQPPQGYFTARAGFTFFTPKRETPDGELPGERVEIEEASREEFASDESVSHEPAAQDSLAGDPTTLSPEQAQLERFAFDEEFEAESSSSTDFEDAPESRENSPDATTGNPVENPNAETGFDLSALEERLNQLENESAGSPEPGLDERAQTPSQKELVPGDLAELETRVQEFEQEYRAAPAPAEGVSSQDEFDGRENTNAPGSQGFEELLDQVASQYEAPPSPPVDQGADPALEDIEEESTGNLTALEQRLRLLESEPEQTSGAPENSEWIEGAASGHASNLEPSSSPNGFADNNTVVQGFKANTALAKTGSFAQGYESASYDFYTGRYAETVQTLSRLIEEYPNHILASNCYYWVGEAQWQANNLQEAIAAFNKVLAFEKSLKKDNALLMLGRCYMTLRRLDEARTAFNRVIAEYPASEAVSKAQEYLRSL